MSEQEMSLMERYFKNELEKSEQLDFEQRMADDADFRKEVALYKRTLTAIDLYAKDAFIKQMQERRPATVASKPRKPYFIGVAVLLLLIISCLVWWNTSTPSTEPRQQPAPSPTINTTPNNTAPIVQDQPAIKNPSEPKQPNSGKLFAKYYRPFKPAEADGAVHGSNSNPVASSTLTDVENTLRNGKYENALQDFDRLPAKVKDNLNAIFLKASALMALEQIAEAKPLFERVAAAPANIYSGEAKWYLSIIALKQNDLPSAKNWLKGIKDDPGTAPNRRAEANNLWKELE